MHPVRRRRRLLPLSAMRFCIACSWRMHSKGLPNVASTRQTLDSLSSNLQESIGVRQSEFRPVLAPAPGKKDVGRRPLRNVGKLAISQIVPDPAQPRVEFSDEALERLALSIRDKGQLSPIRVRWSGELEKWIIICGE